MAKKRVYRKNTVPGSRKGQKWPEQTRTAALCDLLIGNNICAVARRYGVPESTLRSWMSAARRAGSDGEMSLFEAARAEQLRAVGHLAAAGARASVEYAQRRLEASARDTEIYDRVRQMMDEADGILPPAEGDGAQRNGPAGTSPGEDGGAPETGPMSMERRGQMIEAMARHRPMSDFAAANYIRALTGTVSRAADILEADARRKQERKQGGEDGRTLFVLGGELAELGG